MPSVNESVSFQTFRSEVQYLNQHLQAIDASLTNTCKYLAKYKPKTDLIPKALKLPDGKHDTLNHPVSEYLRIYNYTRSKNAEFSIIELYNAFSVYMRNILAEMYAHNPLQIVGKCKGGQSFTFIDIVKFSTMDKIQDEMINKVFRSLEDERSTVKLLDRILSHTDIQLNVDQKKKALMYLQMRHLFIHNNGNADALFVSEYETQITIRANGKLPTNFDTVNNAIQAVYSLIETIDKELIARSIVHGR